MHSHRDVVPWHGHCFLPSSLPITFLSKFIAFFLDLLCRYKTWSFVFCFPYFFCTSTSSGGRFFWWGTGSYVLPFADIADLFLVDFLWKICELLASKQQYLCVFFGSCIMLFMVTSGISLTCLMMPKWFLLFLAEVNEPLQPTKWEGLPDTGNGYSWIETCVIVFMTLGCWKW